jgi:uncharacterized membrane protein YccC
VLKKILINLRNLSQRLNDMLHYLNNEADQGPSKTKLDYSRFVAHEEYSFDKFRDNLSLSSSVFRHSIRMMVACVFGFVITELLTSYGSHSYWVLLTISLMLKPAFSLTKQRNYARLVGTLSGGAIGVLILMFIPDQRVQFAFLVLFMLGAYSFQRVNYIVMVILMTPYILILLSFLGLDKVLIAEERVIDTISGCAIAFAAGYLVFPSWEKGQLSAYMTKVLDANKKYLQLLCDQVNGKSISIMDYKLIRKEVYVSSANLAAAFQRMLSEPKNKQLNKEDVHQFVVLNHILTSNITAVSSSLLSKKPSTYTKEMQRPVRRSILALNESLKKLETHNRNVMIDAPLVEQGKTDRTILPTEDRLLREQLEFIQKISYDIGKVTEVIA